MADIVELRDVIEADLPIMFQHQLDPKAIQMAVFPPRDWTAFVNQWEKILADHALMKKAIVVGETVVGNIVSFERDGKVLVGYWLGSEYWRRGYATAALRVFLTIQRHRPLYAHVADGNAASIRVLEKCGFQFVVQDADGIEATEEVTLCLTTSG